MSDKNFKFCSDCELQKIGYCVEPITSGEGCSRYYGFVYNCIESELNTFDNRIDNRKNERVLTLEKIVNNIFNSGNDVIYITAKDNKPNYYGLTLFGQHWLRQKIYTFVRLNKPPYGVFGYYYHFGFGTAYIDSEILYKLSRVQLLVLDGVGGELWNDDYFDMLIYLIKVRIGKKTLLLSSSYINDIKQYEKLEKLIKNIIPKKIIIDTPLYNIEGVQNNE